MITALQKTRFSTRSVGLAVVGLVMLSTFLLLDRPTRDSSNEAYRGQLRQLVNASLVMEKDLLRSQLGLPEKYGTSRREFDSLRSRVETLRALPENLPTAGAVQMGAALESYLRTLTEYEERLDGSREQLERLRKERVSLHLRASELGEHMPAGPPREAVEALVRTLEEAAGLTDRSTTDRLRVALEALQREPISAGEDTEPRAQLVVDAHQLLSQGYALRDSLERLSTDSLGVSAEQLRALYARLYDDTQQEKQRYRLVLIGLVMLLSVYVVAAFARLTYLARMNGRLRVDLERRVEEYAAALSAAYEDLRDSEARKAALLEGSLDGIITLDAASRILEFSPAAERIFRVPRAQALRRDFLALGLAASVTPEQRQTVVRALQADVEPGRATRIELAGLRADGDVFPAEITLIRVTAEGPPRFSAYVRDITERREVERMKSEFVSTVSHELRTPLTSIRGSLGLMEGGVLGELPGPVLDMVRIARTNTERLIRLINDILDLEKIESGKLELRLQSVEVVELVEATFSGLRGMADAAKVALRAEVHGLGQVRADRDRIIQVLTNLVSNAIKFSPAHSVVEIQAARDTQGQVRLSVVDQGPGIPPEKREKLFGKFQQLDSSDTRSKGGTGLGLAISQAIIEQHGGHIEVFSEPGNGCTFTFSLPAVRMDVGAAPVVRDESRYNVLVATAEPELSTLLRGLLTAEGYRVLRAGSLEEASRVVEAGAPDVLVLEPRLPDGEGLALVRRLRADSRTRELPVVMLSEPSSTEEVRMQRLAWVARPFRDESFLQALRHVLRQPGQARVLVVDDDVDARRLLRSCLERLGAACYEAEDGERAVALARETPPDLIVLDVLLPLLDGFEVVDLLRQGKGRSTPLIVFTVRELTPEQLRQHTLGNTRYILKKPSAEEELSQAARELLGPLLPFQESPPTRLEDAPATL